MQAPPSPWQHRGLVGASGEPQKSIFLVVGIVLFVVIIAVVAIGSSFGSVGFAWFLVPFCGILVLFIVMAFFALSGAFRRAPLPPPPPIQQPMVPAGRQPPIAINCPNCGAPPGVVDRFGMAVCSHCGTRFIVR